MSKINLSRVRRGFRDESGQIIMPWVAVLMFSFLGVSGLTMDVGRAYVAHSQLQNVANAAALAAAGDVYYTSSTSDAYNVANTYSGSSGDKNRSGVGTVTTTVSEGCVSALLPSGSSCSSTSVKNAVHVTESTTVRNYIMPIFWGTKTTTVSASATASMQGQAQGWNVAVIVDATASMTGTTDSNCSTGTASRFTCALESVQTLLQAIPPCSNTTGSACTPSASLFRVSLFSFPNVLYSQRPYDYGCNSQIPTPEPYTLPVPGLSGYTALTYNGNQSTYQVTLPNTGNVDANGFQSDYYSLTSSNHLYPNSEIVKAIGGNSSCAQMATAGGESTYYGGVMYAAQQALKAEQALYPGSQNAIILLSDGQAVAPNTKFPASNSAATPTADGYSVITNSTSNTKNLVNGTKGYYPDFNDECQQAVVAGQYATAQGTRVYAVAYGSADSGCSTASGGTDSSLVSTGANVSYTAASINPCVAMENIASSLNYFYSDYNQSGSGSNCQDVIHNTINLSDISLAIASTFTKPRLLPNTAFQYGVVQTS